MILNVVLGAISSFFVVVLSLLSYYRFVKKLSLSKFSVRDEYDKIDDKFDLYDEDTLNSVKEDESIDKISSENSSSKKSSLEGLKRGVKNISPFFSILRVLSYAFLVISFLYLDRHNLLEIFPFLIGITLGLVLAFFAIYQVRRYMNGT